MTINCRKLMIPFLILLTAILLVSLPPLNGHAIQRHAGDAIRAYKYVQQNGGPGDRWDCKDGRVRWICALRDKEGAHKGLFAVVVLTAAGAMITAFICNKHYAKSICEQAENPWHYDHP